jgi:hypothetical protein
MSIIRSYPHFASVGSIASPDTRHNCIDDLASRKRVCQLERVIDAAVTVAGETSLASFVEGPAPGSGTCRPIHQTSIRSSRPRQDQSTGCGSLGSAPSTIPGATAAISSQPFNPTTASITSSMLDTLPSIHEPLYEYSGSIAAAPPAGLFNHSGLLAVSITLMRASVWRTLKASTTPASSQRRDFATRRSPG